MHGMVAGDSHVVSNTLSGVRWGLKVSSQIVLLPLYGSA